MSVTHVAGTALRVGDVVRQRCAWCGELLLEKPYTDDPADQVFIARMPVIQDERGQRALPQGYRIETTPGGRHFAVLEPGTEFPPPDFCGGS